MVSDAIGFAPRADQIPAGSPSASLYRVTDELYKEGLVNG